MAIYVAGSNSEVRHLTEMINSLQLDLPSAFSLLATGIDIRKLDHDSDRRCIIEEYFRNSQSRHIELRMKKIWRVHFVGPHPPLKYTRYNGDGTMLLWHGTSRTNLASILQNSLKLPVVPRHGSWFGSGIYFADRVETSASFTDKFGPEVFLLCEVALGRKYRLNEHQSLRSAPYGYDSLKVVGRKVPDSRGDRIIGNCTIPCGKTVRHRDERMRFSQARYNEYVVFDQDRIRIKFILHVERRC